jgi:hypothetical protein
MYEDENFKFVKTTWILFHNYTFEHIQQSIHEKKITYKDQDVKLISTSTYLEIPKNIGIDIELFQKKIHDKFQDV